MYRVILNRPEGTCSRDCVKSAMFHSPWMRTISSYRKANREGRPLTDITFERKRASVLVHNDRSRNRKTLTAASTSLALYWPNPKARELGPINWGKRTPLKSMQNFR